MNDISIDLETLDTRPNAAILSIGAQVFDIDRGKMGDTFYVETEMRSAVKAGTISGDTIAWWMQQGIAARHLFAPSTDKQPLPIALDGLYQFCRKVNAVRYWFNGPAEDAVWLINAYDKGAVGMQAPWKYNMARDLRTLACLPGVRWPDSIENKVPHHALHDATYQAKVICDLWAQVKKPMLVTAFEAKQQVEDDDEL